MTSTEKTSRTRRNTKKDDVEQTAPDVIGETETTEETNGQLTPKRRYDVSPTGVGIVGAFEDAEPDNVPGTAASKDVSWLYPPMTDSYERETANGYKGIAWKSFVVTDFDAAERAVRMAATRLGYGVAIRKDAVVIQTDDGPAEGWKVFFLASMKNTRKKEEETSAE